MKNRLLELLKAKFEGVRDAILNRIADKIAKSVTTEEEATTAVAGETFQQVIDSYGDSRATEAQQTAVSNYEKKHGLKDGKAIQQEPPKTQPLKVEPAKGQEPSKQDETIVVYHCFPTSNRNWLDFIPVVGPLYIIAFLHQTATSNPFSSTT